jgi:hypothetical protein
MRYFTPDIWFGTGMDHGEYAAIFDIYAVYIVIGISSQWHIAALPESRYADEIS